jgi:hypothetical protein
MFDRAAAPALVGKHGHPIWSPCRKILVVNPKGRADALFLVSQESAEANDAPVAHFVRTQTHGLALNLKCAAETAGA